MYAENCIMGYYSIVVWPRLVVFRDLFFLHLIDFIDDLLFTEVEVASGGYLPNRHLEVSLHLACDQAPSWRIKHSKNSASSTEQVEPARIFPNCSCLPWGEQLVNFKFQPISRCGKSKSTANKIWYTSLKFWCLLVFSHRKIICG